MTVFEAVLSPGDVLYIPPWWLHRVSHFPLCIFALVYSILLQFNSSFTLLYSYFTLFHSNIYSI